MRKTAKEILIEKRIVQRGKAARYERYLKNGCQQTWSARMPPYCFTELCPDPRYRPGGEKYIMILNTCRGCGCPLDPAEKYCEDCQPVEDEGQEEAAGENEVQRKD